MCPSLCKLHLPNGRVEQTNVWNQSRPKSNFQHRWHFCIQYRHVVIEIFCGYPRIHPLLVSWYQRLPWTFPTQISPCECTCQIKHIPDFDFSLSQYLIYHIVLNRWNCLNTRPNLSLREYTVPFNIGENLFKMSKIDWKTSMLSPWTPWTHFSICQHAGNVYSAPNGISMKLYAGKAGIYLGNSCCEFPRNQIGFRVHYLPPCLAHLFGAIWTGNFNNSDSGYPK